MNRVPMAKLRKIGKRGSYLLLYGVIYVVYGYSLFSAPLRRPDQFVVHDLIPSPWYALAWVVCGLVAACYAFASRPGRDRWGYAALVFMPSITMLSYFASYVLYLMGQPGDRRGWVVALIFAGFGVFGPAIVAGWAEPAHRLPIHALTRGPDARRSTD